MTLKQIDKARYRKHLNIVIACCVIALTALSLGISQTAIFLFTDGIGSHFELNLMGVIMAMLVIGITLTKLRLHPFMSEVVYVWDLKQQLNKIQRKMKSIQIAADQNDINAITILYYNYKACRQLYNLDDNTIIMSELTLKANALEALIQELNLHITEDDFNPSMLDAF